MGGPARQACDDTGVRACDLLVVSHAAVLATNQSVYAELARRGVGVGLLVPSRWRNEYRPSGFDAEVAVGLEGRVRPVSVVGQGRPQRHVHVTRCAATLQAFAPKVVFIEEEPFSVAAIRWSRAARRRRIPYGVQVAETLERDYPAPLMRRSARVLRDASFVVARSPAAAALARRWGAGGEVAVVAHGVDPVDVRPEPEGVFTIAYVGRLVEEKGVTDLLEAVSALDDEVRLVVAGEGPLDGGVRTAGPRVVALGAVSPGRIGDVYGQAHVTCVPSRTMPSWEEQFGRVLTESLVRGVPVIATHTGEIPWVLSQTGGGVMVPERDPSALGAAIASMQADRAAASALGAAGREGVLGTFTNAAGATALAGLVERAR